MKWSPIKHGLICALAALFLFGNNASALTTSGTLTTNETWSGEVELSGDVTVPEGITLTILPGTTIGCWDKTDDVFSGTNASRIEIIVDRGVLNAVGTSNSPILFTSSPLNPPALKADWYGVRLIKEVTAPSVLKHCIFEYAVNGLEIAQGQPTIDHCTF